MIVWPSKRAGWLACSLAAAACASAAVPRAATPGDGARALTIETPGAVRGSRDSTAFEHALLEVGRDAGVALRGDGRLAQLAERMANAGNDPSADALGAAAIALDLGDAALSIQRVAVNEADLLPAALRVELPAAVRALAATHFGLYLQPAGTGAVVVLSRRPLALAPVPRRIASGSVLHLRGRLSADVRGAKLIWRDPLGQRRAYALGDQLELDVRLPTRMDGPHRVELSEQSEHGERALLAFDLDVGEPGARPAALELDDGALVAARRALIARLAAFRGEHGLAAFSDDGQLARRAGARCAAGGGQLREAPTAASEPASETAVADGPDVDALYAGLLADPALRARLMLAEPARLGLELCASGPGLRAVALFASRPGASDEALERASGRVLLAINAQRQTRGAAPLRPDSALTVVAQRAAAALLARPAPDRATVIDRANADLERYALRYRRVAAVAVVVRDPTEAATLEPALDPGAGVVGIATAEPDPGSVAVVLALGWER